MEIDHDNLNRLKPETRRRIDAGFERFFGKRSRHQHALIIPAIPEINVEQEDVKMKVRAVCRDCRASFHSTVNLKTETLPASNGTVRALARDRNLFAVTHHLQSQEPLPLKLAVQLGLLPAPFDFLEYLKARGFEVHDATLAWLCDRGNQRIFVSRLAGTNFFHASLNGDQDIMFYQVELPVNEIEAGKVVALLEERDKARSAPVESFDFDAFLLSRGFRLGEDSDEFEDVYLRGRQRVSVIILKNTPVRGTITYFHAGFVGQSPYSFTYQDLPKDQREADQVLNALSDQENTCADVTKAPKIAKGNRSAVHLGMTREGEAWDQLRKRDLNRWFISHREPPPEFFDWGPGSTFRKLTRDEIDRAISPDVKIMFDPPPCVSFAKRERCAGKIGANGAANDGFTNALKCDTCGATFDRLTDIAIGNRCTRYVGDDLLEFLLSMDRKVMPGQLIIRQFIREAEDLQRRLDERTFVTNRKDDRSHPFLCEMEAKYSVQQAGLASATGSRIIDLRDGSDLTKRILKNERGAERLSYFRQHIVELASALARLRALREVEKASRKAGAIV